MTEHVKTQVIIDIPRSEAWNKLRNISLAHNYVPGIVKTELVSDTAEGVGASRYVYRNARSYIQETVEEWQEGEGFLIRLHRGDKPAPPFSSARFRYHLADAEGDRTLFTATMSYDLPWGALGRWLAARMRPFVDATIRDVALAMKLYYESGQPTTPAALKAFKTARAV